MSVQFNIRQNMSAKELLAEIRGRISGETQQQVQLFERRLKQRGKTLPVVGIRVDEVSQTAIVRVSSAQMDNLGLPTYSDSAQNWMMGVNDEGQYYAHEIENVPSTVKNIEHLLSWVNREDEGFQERVQGDILLQFVRMLPSGTTQKLLAEHLAGHEWYLDAMDKFNAKQIGNHQIITPEGTEAYSIWGRHGQYWAVTGSELVLIHPEHTMKIIQIPKGMAAVLTSQRGRADQQMAD